MSIGGNCNRNTAAGQCDDGAWYNTRSNETAQPDFLTSTKPAFIGQSAQAGSCGYRREFNRQNVK
jgi:hypothetical protein